MSQLKLATESNIFVFGISRDIYFLVWFNFFFLNRFNFFLNIYICQFIGTSFKNKYFFSKFMES